MPIMSGWTGLLTRRIIVMTVDPVAVKLTGLNVASEGALSQGPVGNTPTKVFLLKIVIIIRDYFMLTGLVNVP